MQLEAKVAGDDGKKSKKKREEPIPFEEWSAAQNKHHKQKKPAGKK